MRMAANDDAAIGRSLYAVSALKWWQGGGQVSGLRRGLFGEDTPTAAAPAAAGARLIRYDFGGFGSARLPGLLSQRRPKVRRGTETVN